MADNLRKQHVCECKASSSPQPVTFSIWKALVYFAQEREDTQTVVQFDTLIVHSGIWHINILTPKNTHIWSVK